MIDRPEALAKLVGTEGCNVLSDLKIAEMASGVVVDILATVDWALKHNLVDATCSVVSEEAHLAIVAKASGFAWATKLVTLDYVCKPGEYEKLQFGMGSFDHYVVGDGSGKVSWDPEGDLIARTPLAKLKGKRIFWKA